MQLSQFYSVVKALTEVYDTVKPVLCDLPREQSNRVT